MIKSILKSLHQRLARAVADAGVNDSRMEHAHAATQNLEFESQRLEDALENVRKSGSIDALSALARSMAREDRQKPQ